MSHHQTDGETFGRLQSASDAPAKALLLLAALVLVLGGCAPAATPALAPVSSPAVQPTLLYTVTAPLGYVDAYAVDAWVDDPAPSLGARIIVRGSVTRNGVRIGPVQLRATWMQGGELQVCDISPVYLMGCPISVGDFTPRVFVPITVTMRYQGMVFTGYSGFTPQ